MLNVLPVGFQTKRSVCGVVGDPFVLPLQDSGNMVSAGTAALIVAGMFFTAGALILYTSAWEKILAARMYLGMESFNPTTCVENDSLLAVRGSVASSDGSVSGPLTGENCVAFVREDRVLEREVTEDTSTVDNTTTNSHDGTKVVYSWDIRDASQESVPFEIETDHGPVAVEPGYAELDLPVQGSNGTSLARRILYRVPLVGRLIDRPTKTVEKHLATGDTVTVLGDIQPAADVDGLAGTVRGAGDRGAFTVTSKSGRSLAIRSVVGAALSSLPALLCFAIAIGAIAIGIATGALP